MPRGAPQHHLQPGLCQRGDRHQAAVPVPAASHCGAGRGHQVEGAPGHHRVYAPAGWPTGMYFATTAFRLMVFFVL